MRRSRGERGSAVCSPEGDDVPRGEKGGRGHDGRSFYRGWWCGAVGGRGRSGDAPRGKEVGERPGPTDRRRAAGNSPTAALEGGTK
jgi:hypothetical protein